MLQKSAGVGLRHVCKAHFIWHVSRNHGVMHYRVDTCAPLSINIFTDRATTPTRCDPKPSSDVLSAKDRLRRHPEAHASPSPSIFSQMSESRDRGTPSPDVSRGRP